MNITSFAWRKNCMANTWLKTGIEEGNIQTRETWASGGICRYKENGQIDAH